MKPEQILKNFQLKITNARIKVLELFQRHQFALSQPFLEKNLEGIDRVTLYRTLNTFKDMGVIHKVLDDTYTLKYALCSDLCYSKNSHHEHKHIHFQCVQCNKTTCLDINIPAINLPEGYLATEYHFFIKGICKNCNDSSYPNT